jgi:sugar lactone lactonase YvrE
MRQAEVLAEGLGFGEGPRWRGDRLWFSDIGNKQVMTLDLDGRLEPVVEVAGNPSGLGWLPDGRMLVVSMLDRTLLRLEPDGLVEHADLNEIAGGHCNDMVVDTQGRAYVGNFGFDPFTYSGERMFSTAVRRDPDKFFQDADLPTTATMVRVDPDGTVTTAADGLRCPNGSVITPDGSTLIVAESLGPCLTAFDIEPDGTLTNTRVWAEFPKQSPTIGPDGICLDAEGAVWVADALSTECLRIAEGGEILDRVSTGLSCVACMLGGPNRKTLFLMANKFGEDPRAQVEIIQVDVPGAGLP